MPDPTDIPSFAATQLALLTTELNAELAETQLLLSSTSPSTLARAGLAILNLSLSSQRTGLGGKTVIELTLDPAFQSKTPNSAGKFGEAGDLPEHGIRVGDIVAVAEQPSGAAKRKEKSGLKERGVEGVVGKVGRERVEVVLGDGGDKGEERLEGLGGRCWVVKLANDVTYKRYVYVANIRVGTLMLISTG
jgi:DNA polymerase alpha-associated DNA helicase A